MFGIRIATLLEASNIKPKMIQKLYVTGTGILLVLVWCMKKLTIIFDLHNGNNLNSNPRVLKTKLHEQ